MPDAVAVVEAFVPLDEVQADAQRAILDFCASCEGALDRQPPGHLTASALVVDDDAERVLVLWHRKLGMWLQPGGHVDGEANLAAGALREATEETGIPNLQVVRDPVDLDVHMVRPPGEPAHHHYDVRFVVMAPAGAQPRATADADRFAWVTPAELDGIATDASLRRLAGHGLALARTLAGRP